MDHFNWAWSSILDLTFRSDDFRLTAVRFHSFTLTPRYTNRNETELSANLAHNSRFGNYVFRQPMSPRFVKDAARDNFAQFLVARPIPNRRQQFYLIVAQQAEAQTSIRS